MRLSFKSWSHLCEETAHASSDRHCNYTSDWQASDLQHSFIQPFIISLSLSSSACLGWVTPCSYDTSDWIRQMSLWYMCEKGGYEESRSARVRKLCSNPNTDKMYKKALCTGCFPHFRQHLVHSQCWKQQLTLYMLMFQLWKFGLSMIKRSRKVNEGSLFCQLLYCYHCFKVKKELWNSI